MKDAVNMGTYIQETSLGICPKTDLIENHIFTVGELLDFSVIELFCFNNLNLFDVACIKKFLNSYGYHLVGEDLVEYSDYYYPERIVLLKQCNILIQQRNKIRGKKEFQAEEIVLCQKIFDIFEQVRILRERENDISLEQAKGL